MFTRAEVDADPTVFAFTLGSGYRRVGPLRNPSPPVGPPSSCEPPIPADEGSWHRLIPDGQPDGVYVSAQWLASKRVWQPPLDSQGRRVGFSSTYLAACGWVYGEAE